VLTATISVIISVFEATVLVSKVSGMVALAIVVITAAMPSIMYSAVLSVLYLLS